MLLTVYEQLNAYLVIYTEYVNLDYIDYKLNNSPTTHCHSLQGKQYAKLHIYLRFWHLKTLTDVFYRNTNKTRKNVSVTLLVGLT